MPRSWAEKETAHHDEELKIEEPVEEDQNEEVEEIELAHTSTTVCISLLPTRSSMPDGCVRCSRPQASVPLDSDTTRARLGLRARAAMDDVAS
jgi:hypothetical protein